MSRPALPLAAGKAVAAERDKAVSASLFHDPKKGRAAVQGEPSKVRFFATLGRRVRMIPGGREGSAATMQMPHPPVCSLSSGAHDRAGEPEEEAYWLAR